MIVVDQSFIEEAWRIVVMPDGQERIDAQHAFACHANGEHCYWRSDAGYGCRIDRQRGDALLIAHQMQHDGGTFDQFVEAWKTRFPKLEEECE